MVVALGLKAPSVEEPLESAQQAFAEARYEAAEKLALSAVRPPKSGAALYLAGLARFRAGKPAEALEVLDAAGRAEDAPALPAWNFNRGACLYALSRFGEAEQAFLAATSDESLARVAWANAGFAALDAGFPERAAQWASKARPGASARELALVEELLSQLAGAEGQGEAPQESAYAQGLSAFDAGRFGEARARFLEAAKQVPESGRAWLMAGASAYRLGDRATAREDLTQALTQNLAPNDKQTAREYLDRLATGLRARGPGVDVSASVAAGLDSNVRQIGLVARDVLAGENPAGSPFLEAGLGVVGRFRLSDAVFAELSYAGLQRAYTVSSVGDYSLQLHRASAEAEVAFARSLRLGASLGADLYFTGLSAFRGLQTAAGGSFWFALDEGEFANTRLEVSFARKVGLSEFTYLTGHLLDATLSQELRWDALELTAWYRYRADLLGTLSQAQADVGAGVSGQDVIPFAWSGSAVGASLHHTLGDRWKLRLDLSLEWRNYRADSVLRVQASDGTTSEWNARRRADMRLALGPSVGFRLMKGLHLSARYDVLMSASNIDTRLADPRGACAAPAFLCHRYDYTNGNYMKQAFALSLDGTW